MTAGNLAEADFYRISLQKLQFEQDVSAAQVALVQARGRAARRRRLRRRCRRTSTSPAISRIGSTPSTLDDLKQAALAARPDLLAAQSGVKLAADTHALELGNRTRDVTGEVEYDRAGRPERARLRGLVRAAVPRPQPGQHRAQPRSRCSRRRSRPRRARVTVLTDVVSAWAAYQTNEKVVSLFQSGYLDQAKQSLDISTYVFQRGSGTLLDLLDAERTYRSTELAFRQALAAYMTSVEQLNFVVGKQVMQ